MDTTKIIKGVVNSGRYTVTAPIVKEDYGLYLQIEGVELPSTYEVDFSNSEHNGTSVTMIGNADGVLIPHQFIDTGKDVFAFLYHVGADYGRTVYKFRIPNKVRPDRTDDTPTPEEQSTIDQCISALNEAVAQTAQDVIDADASAQASAESARASANSAVQASLSESNAERAKGNAQASAESASASATASAQSASEAETARQAATSLVAEAQGYADASAQSASASANSASQAQGFAQGASASANSASGYASQADISANTASNKASEASTSAQTASAKASEASQSATNASQSAQTALQAKTDAQTAQGKAEDAQTAAETAQGKAEDAQEAAESAAASVQASAAQIAENTADIADLQTDVAQNEADILKAFPTDSASGAIASFTDGADNLPLKSLVVDIDPVQDTSSGNPSPTNICPISGWTGMQLNANGIVIPISWQTEAGTVYGGKLDVLSGKLTLTNYYCTPDNATRIVYGIDSQSNLPYAYFQFAPKADGNGLSVKTLCSMYKAGNATRVDKALRMWTSEADIWDSDLDVTSLDTVKTYLADLVIVYPLATPIEIQLTPTEVRSLLGTNNIWADTGDTEVEYRADTRLYIEKLTQPEEDDMIADSAITSGQFFMVGNTLYRALTNIASGATITVGTNAQRVSLSDALNLVNA